MPIRRATLAAACIATALLLAAAPPSAPRPHQSSTRTTLTHIANEGLLLTHGNRKVLIDALFGDYGAGFARPADSTQRKLEQARPPFDSVNVVLVTHRHGDHFGAREMTLHLQANRAAALVAPVQVIDSLRQYAPARQLPSARLLGKSLAPGTRQRETINGVTIERLGIPHGGGGRLRPRPEHLAYLIDLGGRRFLHLGDAEMGEDAYAALRLDTARIDVALIPEWMVDGAEGRRLITQWIKPREIVAIHLARGATPRAPESPLNGAPVRRLARSLERLEW